MPDIYPGKIGETAPIVPARTATGERLPLDVIRAFVKLAMEYARGRPTQEFRVQQSGWGYPRQQIAPMFDHCPSNVTLPYGFWY